MLKNLLKKVFVETYRVAFTAVFGVINLLGIGFIFAIGYYLLKS